MSGLDDLQKGGLKGARWGSLRERKRVGRVVVVVVVMGRGGGKVTLEAVVKCSHCLRCVQTMEVNFPESPPCAGIVGVQNVAGRFFVCDQGVRSGNGVQIYKLQAIL